MGEKEWKVNKKITSEGSSPGQQLFRLGNTARTFTATTSGTN